MRRVKKVAVLAAVSFVGIVAPASAGVSAAQVWEPACIITPQLAQVWLPGERYASSVQVFDVLCAVDGEWQRKDTPAESMYSAHAFVDGLIAEFRAR